MRSRILFSVLVVSLFAGTSAYATDQEPQQLVRQVIDHSGVLDAIQTIPEALKGAATEDLRRSGVGGEAIQLLQSKIAHSFDTDTLTQMLEDHVLALMSVEDLRSVKAWLESPTGKKVVAAEVAAGTAQGNAAMAATLPALLKQYEGTPRAQLFGQFDRATHATETLVEGTLSMQTALITAVQATSKPTDLASLAAIKKQVEARRMALRNMLEPEAYASYLFMYRDLSLQELNAYIDFANSDVGSRYVQVLIDGMWDVIAQRTENLELWVADAGRPGA